MKLFAKPLKAPTAHTREPVSPVGELEAATVALMAFEVLHEDLFEVYRTLQESVTVAEDAVKTWAKQHKRSTESDLFLVKYGEGHSRWYDATVLKNSLTPQEALIAEAMGLFVSTVEVDEKILKTLIKSKKLNPETAQAAFREEPTSARVTIERKGNS